MVRRWSRINNFNFFFKKKTFFSFKKLTRIKNFRSILVARRFTKKYTKFKRKAFNRLRHQSNSLLYINIFKFWAKDYLVIKNMVKKQFSLNLFLYNFFFFDWSSCINRNPYIFFNSFFFFVNNFKNKKNYNFYHSYCQTSYCFFKNNYRFAGLGSVESLNFINLFEDNNENLHNALLYKSEGLLFESNFLNLDYKFNNLSLIYYKLILEKIKIFYKIIVMFSLINVLY